ncbi:hypothetical protein [Achromobacter sp. Marseille-Q4954]|uniref:hypothetical protein n=1 Tax=Achromobacter sp. Marseille-Q4954 TaxID=2942203 RepID=UPI002072E3DE|nr:hypothetical protein [Achromobacter sp. Marseille-Q4954]
MMNAKLVGNIPNIPVARRAGSGLCDERLSDRSSVPIFSQMNRFPGHRAVMPRKQNAAMNTSKGIQR